MQPVSDRLLARLIIIFSLFPPLVSGRKVIRHSHDILSELPIKFLLQTAERDQDRFGGLYPQLLRLCSTHFPHLCMVQDTLVSDSLDVSEDSIHSNHLSSTRGKV